RRPSCPSATEGVAGSAAWISMRWPTSCTRCRPTSSSRCASSARRTPAQESLAGDQLRVLDRQRSQLLTALTRQAAALARENGIRVGGTVETQVADTLRAAMADPEAGEALLSGRLTGAMSY